MTRKSLLGILQIIPGNLKISAESPVVAGVVGSSLEFVQRFSSVSEIGLMLAAKFHLNDR